MLPFPQTLRVDQLLEGCVIESCRQTRFPLFSLCPCLPISVCHEARLLISEPRYFSDLTSHVLPTIVLLHLELVFERATKGPS